MHQNSLRSLILALQTKQFSSIELTTHYLQRIEKNKSLNAFITVDEEYALSMAKRADKRLQSDNAPALTGIPMAHKDNLCTKVMPTTCASKMLEHYVSPFNATAVERLEEQGIVMLGKTNMDEFAMGSSNETSYFGPAHNPWNSDYVPSGSSGGSAAAVAACMVPFATGSDTGGSIRQPAAFCGVSGLKPTYGSVSRYGLVAYASSLDQIGIFAHSAEDIAISMQPIMGYDAKDSTSANQSIPLLTKDFEKPITPLRIGFCSSFFGTNTDESVKKAIINAVQLFEQNGAEIVDINLNFLPYWLPCYQVIANAEASSNLSRFDGIRFGHRTKHAQDLRELISRSRSEGFGHEVKRRILTGTHMLSHEQFDTYYVHAQKVRRLISNELLSTLKQVDIILSPTTPTAAFKIGESKYNSPKYVHGDLFTVPANLAGLPAISIPAGFDGDLPISMQLMGNYFSEARLLQIAHFYQQCTEWHKAAPVLGEKK